MKKLLLLLPLAVSLPGCVWTQEIREVTVHKDPQGNILSIDYIERLDQRDVKPWKENFGKYLYKQ